MCQSIRILPSYWILTVCPSLSELSISLGPTNPTSNTVVWETLVFRREGVSPSLRLLVQAFVLLITPVWVTPLPSTQIRTLVYRLWRSWSIQLIIYYYIKYYTLHDCHNPAVSAICLVPIICGAESLDGWSVTISFNGGCF